MQKLKHSLPIALTFIWLGFVCAISFMEAPLKFTAPHLSLQVGVEVGRQVFKALNKVEILFCSLLIGFAIINKYKGRIITLITVITLILLLQSFWMLPAMHLRVDHIIAGHTPPPSNLHLYYIFSEIIKATSLIILGIGLFDFFRQNCLERFFISDKNNKKAF